MTDEIAIVLTDEDLVDDEEPIIRGPFSNIAQRGTPRDDPFLDTTGPVVKVKLDCGHTLTVQDDSDAEIGDMVRCFKCVPHG